MDLVTSLNKQKVGFGCGPLGVHGFGDVDLGACRDAVREALHNDIVFFDTSDAYGKGVSEIQLSIALGADRKDALIATKGGIRFTSDNNVYYDTSPKWIEHAIDMSLKRLGTDYIDIYQLHYWDGTTPVEETMFHLEKEIDRGRIRGYGVSNIVFKECSAGFKNMRSYSFEFSLLNQENVSCIKQNFDIYPDALLVATGVLAQGLLTGKYDANSVFLENDRRKSRQPLFRPERIQSSEPILEFMNQFEVSNAVQAIVWSLESALLPRELNRMSIVGIKNCDQLGTVIKAREILANSAFTIALDELFLNLAHHHGSAPGK